MNAPEMERFREQLLDLGKRLQRDFAALTGEALRTTGGEASGNLSNAPLHLADLGTDNYEEEVAMSLLENGGQRLEEINAALERINRGTFGQCENCNRDIGRERLDAVPYTRLCIDCARKGSDAGADQ